MTGLAEGLDGGGGGREQDEELRLCSQTCSPRSGRAGAWLVGEVAGPYRGGKQESKIQPGAQRAQPPPTLTHPQAREVPGVKIFRSSATMYFANAELYSDALKQRVRPGVPRMSVRVSLTSPECLHPF